MAISAADVKKLRDETDAPMMECKAALTEADGDFAKAKEILREKGRAASAKRADRQTNAGVAMFAVSADGKSLGGVVLECETDFVAKNPDFIEAAQAIASAYAKTDPSSDPLAVNTDLGTVKEVVEGAVAKIRENIKVAKAIHAETDSSFGYYVHHDRTKAVAVELMGTATNLVEVGQKLGTQCVAFADTQFISKSEVPQEIIDKELEIELQRALNEGKKEEIAKNIAMGRINKEYYKRVVLLDQPFYADLAKSVQDYVNEMAKAGNGTIEPKRFFRLAVGEA